MKALRTLLIASLLALAYNASAQESPWKFEFHGFASTTAFVQDNVTGSSVGQQLVFAGNARPLADKAILGADIRQSRMNFSMAGPAVLGAKPKAVFEFDFFSGVNSASQFSEQNLVPRVRIIYTELAWGNTVLQIGQQNDLLITSQLPVALAHTAFPICSNAGCLGWRTPGVGIFQTVPTQGMNLELSARIAKSNWNDTTTGYNNTYGQGGSPIMQGRVRASGKAGNLAWMGYVAGHFASLDMTGPGFTANGNGTALPNNNVAKLQSVAGQIGGKLAFSPVTFMVNAYSGKNLADVIGDLFSQFQTGGVNGATGQIRAKGMWAQLGVDMTKNWSAWAFWGTARLNAREAFLNAGGAGNRVSNEVDGLLVKYTEGSLSTGLDITNIKTSYATALGTEGHTINVPRYARQLMYTVTYAF